MMKVDEEVEEGGLLMRVMDLKIKSTSDLIIFIFTCR
jgi:cell fate regulator YaaT (PSP1 superfamily)